MRLKYVKIYMVPDGVHSLSGRSDETLTTVLPKAADVEEADKETNNLLVFLLMQFLSRYLYFINIMN